MSVCSKASIYLVLPSNVHSKLLIFHHWKLFNLWASKIYNIRRDEWIKIYYTIPKRKKEKKSLIAWAKCVRWGLFIYLKSSIFFFLKKNCELFIHVTTPSEGREGGGGRKKMHVVGNLVKPQQYCHIHIERKNFKTPNLLKEKKEKKNHNL